MSYSRSKYAKSAAGRGGRLCGRGFRKTRPRLSEDPAAALSVGMQKVVRSDPACSGVMFSIDTESGFTNAVLTNASYRLGETIVQSAVTLDECMVFKSALKHGHPESAGFLIEHGIDFIRLNPGSVLKTIKTVADAEQRGSATIAA